MPVSGGILDDFLKFSSFLDIIFYDKMAKIKTNNEE